MATEIIDVIDTATKIGLGAIIAGVATYLHADKMFTNDLKKKNIDDKKEILKEISLKIEKCESHLNESTNSYIQKNQKSFSSEPIILSVREAYEARALTNLIGEAVLSDKIGEMAKSLEEIYEIMYIPDNLKNIGGIIEKVETLKKQMYPLISSAYENTSA